MGLTEIKVAGAGPPAGILEMDYQESPEMMVWEAKAAENGKKDCSSAIGWLDQKMTLVSAKSPCLDCSPAVGSLGQKTTLVRTTEDHCLCSGCMEV